MTLKQLEKIISSMDLNKICDEIENYGFRRANEYGLREFDTRALSEEKSFMREGKFSEKCFTTLYKSDDGYTFINIMFLADFIKIILFTDAPVNEEYVKDINSICKCEKCKKEYMKKELLEEDGLLLCGKCFVNAQEEFFINALTEKIIRVEKFNL